MQPRLAADIGGTFTDIAIERGGELLTAKVLTTPAAPERGVLDGVALVLRRAGIEAAELGEELLGVLEVGREDRHRVLLLGLPPRTRRGRDGAPEPRV